MILTFLLVQFGFEQDQHRTLGLFKLSLLWAAYMLAVVWKVLWLLWYENVRAWAAPPVMDPNVERELYVPVASTRRMRMSPDS
jgi:hypothetical protein